MKPRVLMVAKTYADKFRIVLRNGFYVVEKLDGHDALNRQRWLRLEGDDLRSAVGPLVVAVGRWLENRRLRRAKGVGRG